ncbi:MAG: hypothetical protein IJ555_08800 [Ruminococcus sp.]|nr:hypothetical protein [Ruminococcus sp.]
MIKGILEYEMFYCNHLGASERDEQDIMNFTLKNQDTGVGLLDYIQHFAFLEEDAGIMRTYLVRAKSSDELVGYFSIKAGLVSTNEHETASGIVFDTVPGAELANFAVNYSFVKKYDFNGLGSIIFENFIVPIIQKVSLDIGLKIIYIFALPYEKLIKTYSNYGFKRLSSKSEDELHKRLKPRYDEACIFMFQQL